MNIRLAGFGGQGIVMAGYVLGRAGIVDGRDALQTQSYGSESRGGACKSDVIISDDEILELAPADLDVLVAMAQPALDKYFANVKKDGILIYDSNLAKPDEALIRPDTDRVARSREHVSGRAEEPGRTSPAAPPTGEGGLRAFGLAATDIAHKTFGRDVVANMIMLGYLAGLTEVVSRNALREAISESVPPKTVEMNFQAFEEGFKRGTEPTQSSP